MGRKRKYSGEVLKQLVDQYIYEHGIGPSINKSALARYGQKKGLSVTYLDFSRNEEVKEYIDAIYPKDNVQNCQENPGSIIVYQTLDIENFLAANGSKERIKKALRVLDEKWEQVSRSANMIYDANVKTRIELDYTRRKLKETEKELSTAKEMLKEIQVHNNKLIKENRYLKRKATEIAFESSVQKKQGTKTTAKRIITNVTPFNPIEIAKLEEELKSE